MLYNQSPRDRWKSTELFGTRYYTYSNTHTWGAARKRAIISGRLEDGVTLRKHQANLKRHIYKWAYRKFVVNLDFRMDGVKVQLFLTSLYNDGRRVNVENYLKTRSILQMPFSNTTARLATFLLPKVIEENLRKQLLPLVLTKRKTLFSWTALV